MNYITKGAEDRSNLTRKSLRFRNARSAFRAYLQSLSLGPDDRVLLPSYIGWSAREGSGVFDPIQELGVDSAFYRMTDGLAIDVDDLKRCVLRQRPRVLVLIHYFGFPDPSYESICEFARSQELPVLEDEAHAMLSDVVGGVCGRVGDAAIYSLHKLLPVPDGGQLILNRASAATLEIGSETQNMATLYDFDLHQIAQKRRANAAFLLQALSTTDLPVRPLVERIPDGVVPQSFPVLIERGSRDELYFAMNAAGYGVVSLYHTLIQQISTHEFPDSHTLSHKIMNLPVHQDTDPIALTSMLACLEEQVCRTA